MVASLEAAKKLELIKYCHAMGIIPQEEEGKPVIEYEGMGTVNKMKARYDNSEWKKNKETERSENSDY